MSNGKKSQALKNLEEMHEMKRLGIKSSVEVSPWKKHIDAMLLKGWNDQRIEKQCKSMQWSGVMVRESIPSYKTIGRYRKLFVPKHAMEILKVSDPVAFWSINQIFDTYQIDTLREMYDDLRAIKELLGSAPISRKPKLIETKFRMEGEVMKYEIMLGFRKAEPIRLDAQVSQVDDEVDEAYEADPIGTIRRCLAEAERILEGTDSAFSL